MPQSSEEERTKRKAAMQQGLKVAIRVPFSLAETVNDLWPTMIDLAKVGNINCKSDLQVAARCLQTSVHGALHNVEINMKELEDESFIVSTKKAVKTLQEIAEKGCQEVLDTLEKR